MIKRELTALVLNRWIPPGIVENDIGRRSEVETTTTRFEREEKTGRVFAALETFDNRLTILCLAGKQAVRAILVIQLLADDL